YHNWQTKGENYKNIEGLCQCVIKEDIEKEKYYLTPSKYIKFGEVVVWGVLCTACPDPSVVFFSQSGDIYFALFPE
ncbi:MAG: hypothetical protein IJB55_06890, partial [Firmicutes bacterium]|nr:hypothetical protein [Bacillota bacterium]